MTQNLNILQAQHLKKQYRSRTVVEDCSLEVKAGEIVGLLGPNGAGKTTVFYMMIGLIKSDEGNIFLNGRDITSLPIHVRGRLGISYLPQEPSIFRKLTVQENIEAILELQNLSKNSRLEKLNNLIDEFHLDSIRQSLGFQLSGGERRRVEIARSLANDPKFILLDEPFAGIDPLSVIDLKNLISYLRNRGIGVLITDHNVRETLTICERAYIVHKGKLIFEGSPHMILNNPEVREVYLGQEFEL